MPRPYANPQQIRASLAKCRAQLSNIVRLSAAGNPNATTIARAHLGALNEIVVHVVVTLQGLGPQGVGARTLITRAYAMGVDSSSCAPTIACIESISVALDAVLASLASDDIPGSGNSPTP